jgi:protein-S-isoprenylcysteine O-methyltransferase Ste14
MSVPRLRWEIYNLKLCMNSESTNAAHSRVVIFPPIIPLSGFIIGVALEMLFPMASSLGASSRTLMRAVGLGLLAIGIAGFIWMVSTFRKSHTPIHNARTPATLVETGPFRFSRNPMYLFGSIAYLGLGLLLIQLWAVALLVPVFVTLHYGVVLREEEFLSEHFGAPYERYKERVHRYL